MSETTANTLTETEITKIEFKNILCASCSFIITSNEFTYFVNGQQIKKRITLFFKSFL